MLHRLSFLATISCYTGLIVILNSHGALMPMRVLILGSILFLSACSASQVQKAAQISRGLTGGDQPRSAFLEPSVKEALEHEMRVCLDGNYKDAELRAECIQIAVAKVKEQKGLDEDLDLGGTVTVREIDEEEIIDGTENSEGEGSSSEDEQ